MKRERLEFLADNPFYTKAIDTSSGLPSRRRRHPRAFGAEIHSLWGVLHPAREASRSITALSTRYTLMPQVQNGNWLLEHGTATFANGATIGLVDAYFEIGKNEAQINPAARLVRRDEEMDRGAAITVHSELRKPELPLGPSPILLGAGTVNRPIERIDQAPPVIDWTGSAQNAFEQADTDARKKLRPTKSSWLADFLGTRQSVEYKDLAQRTGLKVVL